MGTGWRRAFCTSARRESPAEKQQQQQQVSPSPSPRSCSKLGGLFSSASNPSTPRLMQQPESAVTTPTLRCRTRSPPPPPAPVASVDEPKLQCKTKLNQSTPPASNTRLSGASPNPSSPISPSRFALFKASLRLSRNRCGICALSMKRGQGTAVFTAECSHSFHFPCISSHIRNHGCLVCPVCSATWRQAPFLSSLPQMNNSSAPEPEQGNAEQGRRNRDDKACSVEAPKPKLYDDDEPLLLSSSGGGGGAAAGGSRFVPIPEADDEDDDGEFQGFSVTHTSTSPRSPHRDAAAAASSGGSVGGGTVVGVDVSVVPVAALVARGRSHQNYVVALKVRAPPMTALTSSASFPNPSQRAPIDLVVVLDVSDSMTGPKLCMLKRALRLLISSLGSADRLSLVAFSSSAKRLLPLRRMSPQGQRSARHIIDRLVISPNKGQGPRCVGEALRKATRVLEDRRERNPVATVMLLSDGQQGDENKENRHHRRHQHQQQHHPTCVPTRFAHLEIPIHDSGFGDASKQQQEQRNYIGGAEDSFAKCVGGLLSVVLQDVHLQLLFPLGEVSAVYSFGASGERAVALGAGNSIRLGDLYAEEERELLVELRVPTSATSHLMHHHNHMSVKCSYRDTATHELIRSGERHIQLPPLQHRPSTATVAVEEQLRNLFVTTRAIAESRRLAELNDHATAIHLLTSGRSLLLQYASISASTDHESLLRSLEAELADIQLRRHHHNQQQQLQLSLSQRRRRERRESTPPASSDGAEPLTPTSAWRAAERLAKVAIMRKSLNRVSDLHGFENARF